MKNIKITCAALLLLAAFSCGKKFDDLNVDPNNPQSVPADFLVTEAQHTMADQMTGVDQAYFTFLWGQYFSQNNYTEESRSILDVGSHAAPLRLTFPVNEQSQNSASYQAAVGLLGGPDELFTAVWWDAH